ncbi:MAG: hypothetical protein K6G22_00390 [Lachnospiraceae bacterium]|nr:hypothetical protein [Lachnospiraceae bacterium]
MKINDVNSIIGDLKDKLDYQNIPKANFLNYSNIKKWIIYDYYKPCDADKPIRDNGIFCELGWDNPEWIDAMFPLRMILTGLISTFPTEYASVKNRKRLYNIQKIKEKEDFGVYDLLDYKMIKQCIGKIRKTDSDKCIERFQTALENYSKNVHTIGNYMPCPDNKYNKTKGYSGIWKYNDRLDVLYRFINENSQQYMDRMAWFEKNRKKMHLEDILSQCETAPELTNLPVQKKVRFDEKQIYNLIEWLERVNILIEARGKRIIDEYYEKIREKK